MRKIILVLFMALALSGCSDGLENAKIEPVSELKFVCINSHYYISNYTGYGHRVYTPLFAAYSDVPMLVRCEKNEKFVR